jgi:hypothetical protein
MIANIVGEIITAATDLLTNLTSVFDAAFDLVIDPGTNDPTKLGTLLLATAGFALAWAGIRFVFGFVNRLLNKSRAGR